MSVDEAMPPPGTVRRIEDLLLAIGAELGRVAGDLARIGSTSERGRTLRPPEIVALQSIDRAEQVMRDLASVLRKVAASDVRSGAVDVTGLVRDARLDQTAALILGTALAPAAAGDVDLF